MICCCTLAGSGACDSCRRSKESTYYYDYELLNPYPQQKYGWICPVCGRGNAPHVTRCTCNDPKPKVTSDLSSISYKQKP